MGLTLIEEVDGSLTINQTVDSPIVLSDSSAVTLNVNTDTPPVVIEVLAGVEGPPGPAGEDGFVGADGADGSKWYHDSGAPDSGLGVIDDWYFDDDTADLYVKTGASTWAFEKNIQGADGIDGVDGIDGAAGSSNIAVQSGIHYPSRPVSTSVPVIWVGTLSPVTDGVMLVGDIWMDPSATPVASGIANTIFDAKGDIIIGTGADTYAKFAASGVTGRVLTEDTTTASGWKSAALPPSLPTGGTTSQYLKKNSSTDGDASWSTLVIPPSTKDLRWVAPTGHTTVDEFNDDSIDAAWVYARHASYPSGAIPIYTELGDALSVKYGVSTGLESATSDGASARHTAILRPLSGIGGTMANGDAFYTAFDVEIRANGNYRMSGLVLSNTATSTGAQLYMRWWSGASVGFRTMTDWGGDNSVSGSDTTTQVGLIYFRIVRISSTTWRGDFSRDGIRWIHGLGLATWSFEPTHVGLCESNWGTATPSITTYECIRKQTGVS